jgi:hypothetical protein
MDTSMNVRFRTTLALAGASLCALASAASAGEPKAVIELFTSQGCSSSPKADQLAGTLSEGGDVLVLTLPVDYWDYLGWKDTFGQAAHSARQRAYALVRGDRKVFTPQVVVNGLSYVVGSDPAAISRAVNETLGNDEVLRVPITVNEAEGQIGVEVGDFNRSLDSEVWLFAISSRKTVTIEAGENAHHEVTYTNVVRRMTRLGAWNGKAAHFMVPRKDAVPDDADHYLAVVQKGSGSMPGEILGVALR